MEAVFYILFLLVGIVLGYLLGYFIACYTIENEEFQVNNNGFENNILKEFSFGEVIKAFEVYKESKITSNDFTFLSEVDSIIDDLKNKKVN